MMVFGKSKNFTGESWTGNVFSAWPSSEQTHFSLMECVHLCFPGQEKLLLLKTPEILGCYYPNPAHLSVLDFVLQCRLMARMKHLC